MWMRGQQTKSFTLNGISELALSTGVSGNSRSRPFPRMKGSDSRSQIMGMNFSFHSRFRISGMFLLFPSRSRIIGWCFFIPFPFPYCGSRCFHSLPVPEFAISQTEIKKVKWAKEFYSDWLKRQGIVLGPVANSYAARVLGIMNKIIILFWLLFVNSGSDKDKKRGDSRMEDDGVENVWAKTPSHATYFLNVFLYCLIFFPFPFPGIPGSESLWFPFLKCGNAFFSFPSRSRVLGIDFCIPFPFPNFGNVFFAFPSRSRILGMDFFHSVPIP